MSLRDMIPVPQSLGSGPSMLDRAEAAIREVEEAREHAWNLTKELRDEIVGLRALVARMEALERQRAERTRREAGITSADMDAIE